MDNAGGKEEEKENGMIKKTRQRSEREQRIEIGR